MKPTVGLEFWFPLLVFASGTTAFQAPYNIPEFVSSLSNSWPSASKWRSLNTSLGGRLEVLRPWGAVCYSSDPLFDYENCQAVLSGYDNDTTVGRTLLESNSSNAYRSFPLLLARKFVSCSAVDKLGSMRLWKRVCPELQQPTGCIQSDLPPGHHASLQRRHK